jgi:hypothetical protein
MNLTSTRRDFRIPGGRRANAVRLNLSINTRGRLSSLKRHVSAFGTALN